MSIKQMSRVWEMADVNQGTLLVLLALADWANDAGVCWPSVPAIARKARLSDRQVRRILDDLEERGIIAVQENRGRKKGGEYATSVYKLNLTICPVFVELKPDTDDMEDLTPEAPKPDTDDSAIRKEPSVSTTVIEPSGEKPPEDLPPLAFAYRVTEELCLSEPGMIHAVAGAINFCVKFENMSKSQAAEHLISRAREEIATGGAPNRFWFTDRKWRQGNGNGVRQVSKADAKERRIIDNVIAYRTAAAGATHGAGNGEMAVSRDGKTGVCGLDGEPEIIAPRKDSGCTQPADGESAKN